MATEAEIRQKLIGEMFPYVFIESVTLDEPTPAQLEDVREPKSNEPTFVRNEYGTNKQKINTNSLDENEEKSVYNVTLNLSMNDLLNSSTWFNTPMRGEIRVKILLATSKEAHNAIKSASFRDITAANKSLRPHIKQRIVSIPLGKDLKDYAVRQVNDFDDILCTIKLKETFLVNSDYIAFSAFPYVEIPPLFGAKNNHKVLSNGIVNGKSYSYYSPDGTLWKGPVHRHASRGVMQGKKHTQQEHKPLTVVEHSNKVRDLTIFKKFAEHQGKISLVKQETNGRLYSDLLLTCGFLCLMLPAF